MSLKLRLKYSGTKDGWLCFTGTPYDKDHSYQHWQTLRGRTLPAQWIPKVVPDYWNELKQWYKSHNYPHAAENIEFIKSEANQDRPEVILRVCRDDYWGEVVKRWAARAA